MGAALLWYLRLEFAADLSPDVASGAADVTAFGPISTALALLSGRPVSLAAEAAPSGFAALAALVGIVRRRTRRGSRGAAS